MSFTANEPTDLDAGVEFDDSVDFDTTEAIDDPSFETDTDVQAEPAASTPNYLDPETYGDHLVRVKVNGEEMELPFREALNGVMMQQSYTRKTQELAQMRQQLANAERIAQALQADPERTIRVLAESYGVQFAPQTDEWGDPISPEPTSAVSPDLVSRLDRLEQTLRQTALDREIAELETRYGPFDVDDVMRHALKIGTSSLEVAYRDLHFEELQQKARAAQALEQRQREEQQRLAAKRQAQVTTSNGRAPVSTPAQKKPTSIREAFLLAKEQLGA